MVLYCVIITSLLIFSLFLLENLVEDEITVWVSENKADRDWRAYTCPQTSEVLFFFRFFFSFFFFFFFNFTLDISANLPFRINVSIAMPHGKRNL